LHFNPRAWSALAGSNNHFVVVVVVAVVVVVVVVVHNLPRLVQFVRRPLGGANFQ
jgi:hypothetical protein